MADVVEGQWGRRVRSVRAFVPVGFGSSLGYPIRMEEGGIVKEGVDFL